MSNVVKTVTAAGGRPRGRGWRRAAAIRKYFPSKSNGPLMSHHVFMQVARLTTNATHYGIICFAMELLHRRTNSLLSHSNLKERD